MKSGNFKTIRKRKLIWFALSVAAVITVLIIGMRQSINASIYSERKELLGRLVESSAVVINDNIAYGQLLTDMISDNAEMDMADYDAIEDYIERVSALASYAEHIFFFVDSNGKYYSSDGIYGKITDAEYYSDVTENKLSYISSLPHLDPEKAYLIFRNRLSTPVHIMTEHGEEDIRYCGMLYDIDNLNDTVSQEFSGDNNTFIYNDTTGVMLYKSFGIRLLIDGYNIYPKFEKSKIVHGEESTDLIEACRSRQVVIAALDIGGEEYYFCSAPIAPKDWSVSFIIQSKYLNDVSGNAFGRIVLYIALIAVLLGVSIIYVSIASYRNRLSAESIKEIKELNNQLEGATKAKSDFLSNMSHDIRTPINGIMGMTTIAKGVEGNPAKTNECLDKIEGASYHLLSLINDVLDMTRIERGKTEIAEKPIDIRAVCDNCSSIIRGQMQGRDINFTTEVSGEHTRVIGDDLHLRQIFINILGNAVKFTKDGGSIKFGCAETEFTGETVTFAFTVEDTGIGMKKEFLLKIFDAFSQDDAGARSEYKGTGLGMTITRQLTELMGGKIEVESEFGKGSKFTVTIPFAVNTAEDVSENTIVYDADIKGVNILLVEDNELNMEIATELLEGAGANITAACDGMKAVECFSESNPHAFDVILMDIMMPVMNGLEAARAIRALNRSDAKTIPILAMTANAFENDIRNTMEAGMNAHLSKPINIDDVVKTVAYYVRKEQGEE